MPQKKNKLFDYTDLYSTLVTFNPNKNISIHKWYPLVEGYSRDLVKSIINEQKHLLMLALILSVGLELQL